VKPIAILPIFNVFFNFVAGPPPRAWMAAFREDCGCLVAGSSDGRLVAGARHGRGLPPRIQS